MPERRRRDGRGTWRGKGGVLLAQVGVTRPEAGPVAVVHAVVEEGHAHARLRLAGGRALDPVADWRVEAGRCLGHHVARVVEERARERRRDGQVAERRRVDVQPVDLVGGQDGQPRRVRVARGGDDRRAIGVGMSA